jgi:hypothetical protein
MADFTVHKEVTHTVILSQTEMELLNDMLCQYKHDILERLPDGSNIGDQLYLINNIGIAERQGRL